MKKLCVLLPMHWSGATGGAEIQARMLTEEVVRRKAFEVHYVARNVAPDYRPQGYMIHRVPPRRAVAGTFILEAPSVLKTLEHIRPDVIYQRVASAYTGVGAYYARHHGARMLWHVANDRDLMPQVWRWSLRAPFEIVNRHMIDYGARHATTVVVQNREQAALLAGRYGRTDAIRIPNFHRAPDAFGPRPAHPFLICWIANLKPHKRPEVFLELARQFSDRSDLRFVMIGAQQMHGRSWLDFQSRLAATPNVEYLGPRTPDEVEALLERAAVFVNTSEIEGFANTFIQAWLRKVAVVSFEVNPDGLFDDDRYGLHARRDPARLRAALERLIGDAALREDLTERAADFARREYSRSNLERLIELLDAPSRPTAP